MTRLAFAMIILVGVTALAPAPFAKPDRKRERQQTLLPQLQGTWSITSKQLMRPNGQLLSCPTREKLQIEKDSWQLISPNVKPGVKFVTRYKVALDPGLPLGRFRVIRSSNQITWHEFMAGIVTVEEDSATMLYRLSRSGLANADLNPGGFDVVPEGWYLLRLKRVR